MKTPDQLQTATDFLQFFEAIPEEKWCCGDYTGPNGSYCTRGHLGERDDDKIGYPTAVLRLGGLLGVHTADIAYINDGKDIGYPQPTPKARICAALRDAIAKGA